MRAALTEKLVLVDMNSLIDWHLGNTQPIDIHAIANKE